MAWLQKDPSGNFHISFRFGGKKFKRSLRTQNQKQATSRKLRLEETIQLVDSGRGELPTNVDIVVFLLSDGKLAKKHLVQDVRLASLTEQFFDHIPENSLEASTIKMMQIHERHLHRLLGQQFNVAAWGFKELQDYVNKRSREKGTRGRTVGASTIQKEIVTLRSTWNWAIKTGLLQESVFPSKGLRYPKSIEHPPFQTFDSVLAQTKDLTPDSHEAKNLWSTVFLNRDEVEELLNHVQSTSNHPFLYPMFVFAAHTGARRSEILRSCPNDFGDTLTVRERKRKKGRWSTRQVPISSRLRDAINEWLIIRPESPILICNTADRWGVREAGEPITYDQANHHFAHSLKGSRFSELRGWHVFRHSFCSNCALQGIDARLIDEWVGHTTEEMRRRYRHFFPSSSKAALKSVFG